jgi:magnesium chelatase family protein
MARALKTPRQAHLEELLGRNHTLHGGILFGLDGHIVELQARAVDVLKQGSRWDYVTKISGMARGAIAESLDRINGDFSKLRIEKPEVEILINLAPADLPKEGTWLDLPLAMATFVSIAHSRKQVSIDIARPLTTAI